MLSFKKKEKKSQSEMASGISCTRDTIVRERESELGSVIPLQVDSQTTAC